MGNLMIPENIMRDRALIERAQTMRNQMLIQEGRGLDRAISRYGIGFWGLLGEALSAVLLGTGEMFSGEQMYQNVSSLRQQLDQNIRNLEQGIHNADARQSIENNINGIQARFDMLVQYNAHGSAVGAIARILLFLPIALIMVIPGLSQTSAVHVVDAFQDLVGSIQAGLIFVTGEEIQAEIQDFVRASAIMNDNIAKIERYERMVANAATPEERARLEAFRPTMTMLAAQTANAALFDPGMAAITDVSYNSEDSLEGRAGRMRAVSEAIDTVMMAMEGGTTVQQFEDDFMTMGADGVMRVDEGKLRAVNAQIDAVNADRASRGEPPLFSRLSTTDVRRRYSDLTGAVAWARANYSNITPENIYTGARARHDQVLTFNSARSFLDLSAQLRNMDTHIIDHFLRNDPSFIRVKGDFDRAVRDHGPNSAEAMHARSELETMRNNARRTLSPDRYFAAMQSYFTALRETAALLNPGQAAALSDPQFIMRGYTATLMAASELSRTGYSHDVNVGITSEFTGRMNALTAMHSLRMEVENEALSNGDYASVVQD
jgi:hypothetical protein